MSGEARLRNIIDKQANLIEELTKMLNHPLYLWFDSTMRAEIQREATKAVVAARRVLAEQENQSG